jgi:TPR repeat protein
VPNREHPEPLYELAIIYETGLPPYIMQDFAYARGMLQEAADFGYPAAIYRLGYCYEHGLMGFEVNPVYDLLIFRLKVLGFILKLWNLDLLKLYLEWQDGT